MDQGQYGPGIAREGDAWRYGPGAICTRSSVDQGQYGPGAVRGEGGCMDV